MTRLEPLGIRRLDSLHFYVRDLDRMRRLLVDTLDFAELGESDDDLTTRGRQKSVVFQAGDARVLVSTPQGDGGRASRWLRKHPEGVGTLAFEVEDIETHEPPECISGLVLKGVKKPTECPAFGTRCTPQNPLGATMVSAEGACAAYYNYGRHLDLPARRAS